MDTLSSQTQQTSDVYPLDDFYIRGGRDLPAIDVITAEAVPEPYRSLLVHETDMTSTLERFHDGRVHIKILGQHQNGSDYFREVLLALDGSSRPVEFGAIRIDLSLFAPEPRAWILEGRLPLGKILAEASMNYSSRPRAFLKMTVDPFMASALQLTGLPTLYGRRNTLFDEGERPLADIVEILPPSPVRA